MAEPRRPAPTRGAPEGAGRARGRRQRRALRRRQPRRAHRADGQARGVGRRRARGRRRALRRDHLPGALIRRPLKQVGVRARRRIIRGRSLTRSLIIRARTSPRIVRVEETLPIHKRPRVQRAEPALAVRGSRRDRTVRRGRVQVVNPGTGAVGFTHRGAERTGRRARSRRSAERSPLPRGDDRTRIRRRVDVVHRGVDLGCDANPAPVLRVVLAALLGHRRHHRTEHGGVGDGNDEAGHRPDATRSAHRGCHDARTVPRVVGGARAGVERRGGTAGGRRGRGRGDSRVRQRGAADGAGAHRGCPVA